MGLFIARNKNVEVNGQTILSIVDGMSGFESKAQKILEKNGLANITPNGWYPQQAWLNAFKEIYETVGESTVLNIGMKIPEKANFPDNIDTIESALESLEIAYHMNHRLNGQLLFDQNTGAIKDGIGHYYYEKIGEREVKLILDTPFPCALDKGIIKGLANKFKPIGSSVKFKEKVTDGCRSKGGGTCTYYISW